MSKRNQEVIEESVTAIQEVTVTEVPTANFTAFLHRSDHPGNRSTYTIQGNPGCIVVKNSLFLDGVAPQSITLDVEMVQPKAKAASVKLDKLNEQIAKAEAILKAAQEKVAAAQAKIA